ncbi:MAG TPA: CheR family methyltransferase, partial [Hyphomicrobiales bacterium]|nr:CheR family methyltransferase [Hyphomicrobiales bacterium]
MKDADCVGFLQWALPKLGLRWPGFRKVRRQVCKRVSGRMKALGLAEIGQYRRRLDADPAEWRILDAACRITVSRFYRDAEVFAVLRSQVMPALAETARAERRPVRCWCAGCASGEEVYTLTILWAADIAPSCPDVEFEVIGTDAEPVVLRRAVRGCFSTGSLKDLPSGWRERAFAPSGGAYCVADAFRRGVSFLEQDIREQAPPGPFDL